MNVLDRLQRFMLSRADADTMLNAPAEPWQLEAAEKVMEVSLPADVRAAYLRFNGVFRNQPPQRPRGAALFLPSYDWVDLDRMVTEWQTLRKTYADLEASGRWQDVPDAEITADMQVRPVDWHPKWIPIGLRGTIDRVCIDMAPGPAGARGQLIYAGLPDGPEVTAASFSEYLERLLDGADAGRLVIDVDGGWKTAAGRMARRLQTAGL